MNPSPSFHKAARSPRPEPWAPGSGWCPRPESARLDGAVGSAQAANARSSDRYRSSTLRGKTEALTILSHHRVAKDYTSQEAEEEGKRERNDENGNLLHPENMIAIYCSTADDEGPSEKLC